MPLVCLWFALLVRLPAMKPPLPLSGGLHSPEHPAPSQTRQVILCDQMTSYLQSYLPKEVATASAAPSASAVEAPEAGMKRVKKKGEGEEEELFALKGKGGKKGKKGGKKDDKPAVVKIQHSIDTIAAFGKLKVAVPLTTAEVPATIEALKVRCAPTLPKRT